MSKYLSNLQKLNSKSKKAKRVGKGGGSGKGFHTSTRGANGQKARSGGNIPLYFEGGQLPFIKRLPYLRGFNNINKKDVFSINLAKLNKITTKTITRDIISNELGVSLGEKTTVKVLGKGKIDKTLHLKGLKYSKRAKEKIVKAGGKAE